MEDSRHKLRKTAVTEAPQQEQDNTKLKEQGSAPHKAVQPDIVQDWKRQRRSFHHYRYEAESRL
jgi:hypothetical protein